MIDISLAVAGATGGVGSLYASWRGYWPHRLTAPAGWLLLVLSCIFWVRGAGIEFGIVYAFLCMAFVAWLVVAGNYEARRRHTDKPRGSSQNVLPDARGLWRNLVLFLFAVPLAGYVAILVSVSLVHLLPWTDVNALVAGILLMPVLWGLASYWVCADTRPLRPALTLACCGLVCAFYIYG